jgi:hypothetical protein
VHVIIHVQNTGFIEKDNPHIFEARIKQLIKFKTNQYTGNARKHVYRESLILVGHYSGIWTWSKNMGEAMRGLYF